MRRSAPIALATELFDAKPAESSTAKEAVIASTTGDGAASSATATPKIFKPSFVSLPALVTALVATQAAYAPLSRHIAWPTIHPANHTVATAVTQPIPQVTPVIPSPPAVATLNLTPHDRNGTDKFTWPAAATADGLSLAFPKVHEVLPPNPAADSATAPVVQPLLADASTAAAESASTDLPLLAASSGFVAEAAETPSPALEPTYAFAPSTDLVTAFAPTENRVATATALPPDATAVVFAPIFTASAVPEPVSLAALCLPMTLLGRRNRRAA